MKCYKQASIFILFLINFITNISHQQSFDEEDKKFAIEHLKEFGYLSSGYLSSSNASQMSDEELENAIRIFQKYFHLNVTGKLNDETVKQMNKSRCGNKDFGDEKIDLRIGDGIFTGHFTGYKWGKKNLTYYIRAYQPKIVKNLTVTKANGKVVYYNAIIDYTPKQIDQILRNGFNKWTKYTTLTFTQVFNPLNYNDYDIEILFTYGDHGPDDHDQFDGDGHHYAHAAHTLYDSHIHFDYEDWDVDQFMLQHVATHEMGHVLGLHHNDNWDSIMYPEYYSRQEIVTSDIKMIQILYGPNEHLNLNLILIPDYVPDYSDDAPDLCLDSKINAISNSFKNTFYLFKDLHVFEFTNNFTLLSSSPRRIFWNWKSLKPSVPVEAAVLFNDQLYLFTETQIGVFNDKNELINYGNIYDFFKYPNESLIFNNHSVDSAFTSQDGSTLYLIKFFAQDEHIIYSFDKNLTWIKTGTLKQEFNVLIKERIDGAIASDNGFTYIFTREFYYRIYNKIEFESDSFKPRQSNAYLFNCRSKTNATLNSTTKLKLMELSATDIQQNENQINYSFVILIILVTVILLLFVIILFIEIKYLLK